MKIVVLAQTPPPLHGQSLMVRQLLETLRAMPGTEVEHVNLALSRNFADIGQPRVGKAVSLFACARKYRWAAHKFGHRKFVLYYVPAPLRTVPLVRDTLLLPWARGLAGATVLHWHAAGMANATGHTKQLARWAYRNADLSLVLEDSLRADADAFAPRRVEVLPNAMPDAFGDSWSQIERERQHRRREIAEGRRAPQLLFMSALRKEKGLFDALRMTAELASISPLKPVLHCAGEFASQAERDQFDTDMAALGVNVRMHGFIEGARKAELMRLTDVLLLPTRYAHEASPLVIIEAFSAGLPVAVTDWRGIPAMLPPRYPLMRRGEPMLPVLQRILEWDDFALLRQHYLQRFSLPVFADRLSEVLRPLEGV